MKTGGNYLVVTSHVNVEVSQVFLFFQAQRSLETLLDRVHQKMSPQVALPLGDVGTVGAQLTFLLLLLLCIVQSSGGGGFFFFFLTCGIKYDLVLCSPKCSSFQVTKHFGSPRIGPKAHHSGWVVCLHWQ